MSLESIVKQDNKKNVIKDYKKSVLVREFYKFVAKNNLREIALRGLKVAQEEKQRIINNQKSHTIN